MSRSIEVGDDGRSHPYLFLNASAAKGEQSVFGGSKGYPPFLLQSLTSWLHETSYHTYRPPELERLRSGMEVLVQQCDVMLEQQVQGGSHESNMLQHMMQLEQEQQQQMQMPSVLHRWREPDPF